MPSNDSFGAVGGLFGTPGDLIGPDVVIKPPSAGGRTLLAIPKPARPAEDAPRPRLLTLLPGATEPVLIRDAKQEPDNLPPPVELKGALSAVRAAMVAHQHEENLWAQPNFPSHFGQSTQPDLTEEEIDARFETVQLYSYLPPSMALTRDDLSAMLRPSARPAYLAANLRNVGINVGDAKPVPEAGTLAAAASLPDNTPFAERLTQFCNDPYFTLANV